MAENLRMDRKRLLRGVVVALSCLWALWPSGGARAAEAAADPVVLVGYGSEHAMAPALSWSIGLYSAQEPAAVTYVSQGERQARGGFVLGEADFVVSGEPFTAKEVGELEKAGKEVLSVPIQATALTFLMSGSFPYGLKLCRPDCVSDEAELIPYVAPLRLDHADLVDIFLDSGSNWVNPGFLSRVPAGTEFAPPIRGAMPIVRSDPDTVNKLIQQYLATVAPAAWQLKLDGALAPDWKPDESWPFSATPSKQGVGNMISVLEGWQSANPSSGAEGGVIAPVTKLAADMAILDQAAKPDGLLRTELWLPEVLNGAGEWIASTPETITAAVAAGGGAPLHGLTEPVPGAYPLTWVNRLYAPTSGLTGSEANALATMIRWQVTVGNESAAALGDGRLTSAMVQEALDGADELVESNCTAAGLDTESVSDPGIHAPEGMAEAVAPLDLEFMLCKVPGTTPSTPSTTVVSDAADAGAPPAPSVLGSGTGHGSGSSSGLGSYSPLRSSTSPAGSGQSGVSPIVQSAASGASGATAAGSTSVGDTRLIAQLGDMPLPLPGTDPRQMDRLATLALGALLFLAGRRLILRLIGSPS